MLWRQQTRSSEHVVAVDREPRPPGQEPATWEVIPAGLSEHSRTELGAVVPQDAPRPDDQVALAKVLPFPLSEPATGPEGDPLATRVPAEREPHCHGREPDVILPLACGRRQPPRICSLLTRAHGEAFGLAPGEQPGVQAGG